jgi:hypothetical protein
MSIAVKIRLKTARIASIVSVLVACLAGNASAADQASVDVAITKAQHWLLANESNGNWENLAQGEEVQATGWTAAALDALLSSGINAQDPGVSAAVKYLEKTDTNGVYALGMRMQVWLRLPASPEVRRCAIKDSNKLLTGIGVRGEAKGMYSYHIGAGEYAYSHSRSQYGVLGMAAAAQMGINVPDSYWKTIETCWADHQAPDGGWGYKKTITDEYPESVGMTTAGSASLFLAADALHDSESLDCRGAVELPAITRSLKWLSDHSSGIATSDSAMRNLPYAALYGVERTGAAGGIKYFGSVNWFKKGSDWLVENQEADGSWARAAADLYSMSPLADTAFALLFLAHGRAPVFMEKLDYAADPKQASEWNERPRDVANLAHRTGMDLEQELSWEIVTLDSPVDDYHDAPILYVSGKNPLKLTDPAKAKLRDFVQGGGMIVANADCGGIGFANSFRRLAVEISPYEFRTLPHDHPIFTRQQYPSSRWKSRITLYGLSNGVRELMILIPNGDPGRTWEQGVFNGHEQVWELGADLFEYVASRSHLRSRGESYVVARDESVKADRTIPIGRIQYGGNWDPEPGGWRRLANVMHDRLKIDLDVRPVKIDGDFKGMAMLHLTGTQIFHPSTETLNHLKDYVTRGGTLVVDAAGGSAEFTKSFEPELIKTFGELKLIPADDSLFTGSPEKLTIVHYRSFGSEARGILDQPRLKGFKTGNRWAVLFSSDDLSAGLVGQQVDGILGYEPQSATDIMEHIIDYAARRSP